jgi:hypothetical protein
VKIVVPKCGNLLAIFNIRYPTEHNELIGKTHFNANVTRVSIQPVAYSRIFISLILLSILTSSHCRIVKLAYSHSLSTYFFGPIHEKI